MSSPVIRTSVLVVGTLFASAGALAGITAANNNTTYVGGVQVGFAPGGAGNTKWGQTFLAQETGKLQSILVRGFNHNITANTLHQSLRIDIFAADDGFGFPFGPALGGWDTPAADIPADNTDGYLFAREGAPVHLVAGERYAFIMGAAVGTNVNFSSAYGVGYTSNTYVDGRLATWHQGLSPTVLLDFDLSFEVTVPTPGGAAFLALAGLATLRRRSR